MVKVFKISLLIFITALIMQVCLAQEKSNQANTNPSPNIKDSPAWQEFSPPSGQFVILMPEPPISYPVQLDSQRGIVAHIYGLDTQLESYAVSYIEFSEPLDKTQPSKVILDGIRDKELTKIGGKLLEEEDISIEGHPGRELTIEVTDGFWVDRIYLVGKRLYTVSAFTTKAIPEAREITESQKITIIKYLDSFKLKLEQKE